MMPRTILRAIAMICVLLGAAAPAWACKCAVVSRAQAIAATPVVFEGRVMKIETQEATQLTTFAVVRSIKGLPGHRRLKVQSRIVSAACGYDFRDARKTLLVGGHVAEGGVLTVSRCTMYNLNR